MIKVTYHVGLNDKDTGQQHFDRDSAHALIAQILQNNGYISSTLYDANGMWKTEREATIVIELLLYDDEVNNSSLVNVAHTLRKAFNQSAIMVTKTKLDDMYLVTDNEL